MANDHVKIEIPAATWICLSDDEVKMLEVMLEAFDKYRERDDVHRGLWKEGGAEDSAHHLKHKAARVKNATENPEQLHPADGIDDALDAINYAAFYVLNARADRWRPNAT